MITRGNPQEVKIVLRSVDSIVAPQSDLKGRALRTSPQYLVEHTGWRLVRLGDDAVPTGPSDPEPNLEFNSKEHRVGGSGGCNRLMGTYELEGQSLRFGKMASTMMMCVKAMDLESHFLQALEAVRSWRLECNHLDFLSDDGKLLARFQARTKK